MDMANILIVDDDKEIVESTSIFLMNEGYNVIKAYDGLEALEILSFGNVHLVILDVMMPKLDGIRATLKIREEKNIPIIIISAKTQDSDKILGLNTGADDYLTKPFNPLELVARVKSQLRRFMTLGNNIEKASQIKTGGLCIDTDSKTLTLDGEQIKLTATEYGIMELFMCNLNHVFSIDEIYEKVWKEPGFNPENTVAVHIRRIREKIEINPGEPKYLKVVWGIGYKIEKI